MVIIIAVRVAWVVFGAFSAAVGVILVAEWVAGQRAAEAVALVVVRAFRILAPGALTHVVAFAVGVSAGIRVAFVTAWVATAGRVARVSTTTGITWVATAGRITGIAIAFTGITPTAVAGVAPAAFAWVRIVTVARIRITTVTGVVVRAPLGIARIVIAWIPLCM